MRPLLVAPPNCGGLPEALAALLARLIPAAPLGLWMLRIDLGLIAASLAAFALLVRRTTGSVALAVVATLAMAMLPAFHPALSGFASLGVLGAVMALSSRQLSIVGLLTGALVTPRATLPLALLAAWRFGGRPSEVIDRWRALVATALVAGAVALLCVSMPTLPPPVLPESGAACLVPSSAALANRLKPVAAMLSVSGPFPVALAALGAFVAYRRFGGEASFAVALYALAPPITSGESHAGEFARSFAPALVVFWLLVAIGLAEAVRTTARSVAGRVGATLLALLLPAFQVLRVLNTPVSQADWGHSRMSLRDMSRILAAAPDDSAWIDEDATTDALLRASDGNWQLTGKRLHRVSATPYDVRVALSTPGTHVFALPLQQSHLQSLGFELKDAGIPGVSGVAAVGRTAACQTVGNTYSEIDRLVGESAIAFVVDDPRETLGVVLFVGAERSVSFKTRDWTAASAWTQALYRLSAPVDRAQFDADASEEQLPRERLQDAKVVTRVGMWRDGGAPAELAMHVDPPPDVLLARTVSAPRGARVSLCPAFPYEIRPLTVGR